MTEQLENIFIALFKSACGELYNEVDMQFILNITKLFKNKQTRLIVMATLFDDYLKTKIMKKNIELKKTHKNN